MVTTPHSFPYRRVNVVGSSCSGKSTMAAAIAAHLGVPLVEMDALYWGPNWAHSSDEVMRARLQAAISGDAWVVDGNYSRFREVTWERVEAVVWLAFPLRTVLWRYARRTVRRIRTREVLWAGNRERLSMHLFDRDSLLWWILTTYHRRRRDYPPLFAARPDIAVVWLRSAREADRWLAQLRAAP